MDGSTTSTGGQPMAPFLTDEQYEMLFDEPRPNATPHEGPMSTTRASFVERRTTRWDRHQPSCNELLPPPIPRLDLTGAEDRLELDIFAEDRAERSMDIVGTYRPRFNPDPVQFMAEDEPAIANHDDIRSRAVSLAFAFAALTATIALWMIAIAVYY